MSVGDSTIPLNPGNITGSVPIVRYDFRPQAVEDATISFDPGDITGSVPIYKSPNVFGAISQKSRKPVKKPIVKRPLEMGGISKTYGFRPHAAEDVRVSLKYPSGSITGSVPIDPREMLVYHNVV